MNGIFVDDERSSHINFCYEVKNKTELGNIEYFFNSSDALAYAKENLLDYAFLDIELHDGMEGISLCKELRLLYPHIEVVFITAYNDYAREAYRVGACAYLSKPYVTEELNTVLDRLQKLLQIHRSSDMLEVTSKKSIVMKTFGNFDMLMNQVPVNFKVAKAKEMLAFLVEQRGGTVSSAQIFLALWENQEYSAKTSTYVRRTARSLRDELESIGAEDVLVINRNSYSVDTSQFTCDFYKLIEGDREIASQYNDKYMDQYSWGELTVPWIEKRVDSLTSSNQ